MKLFANFDQFIAPFFLDQSLDSRYTEQCEWYGNWAWDLETLYQIQDSLSRISSSSSLLQSNSSRIGLQLRRFEKLLGGYSLLLLHPSPFSLLFLYHHVDFQSYHHFTHPFNQVHLLIQSYLITFSSCDMLIFYWLYLAQHCCLPFLIYLWHSWNYHSHRNLDHPCSHCKTKRKLENMNKFNLQVDVIEVSPIGIIIAVASTGSVRRVVIVLVVIVLVSHYS